ATTQLSFRIDAAEKVDLSIYDATGRFLYRWPQQNLTAGVHRIQWNGTNTEGEPAASGVYFYRLSAGKTVRIGKLVLLR
ncbi:T9SS type A sorting domain-containing protein, partial [candidate division KSB1 bacterium]|nr:T9SS type A sorting domain-containing protein [candidate division KSB1 bacterium]